MAQDVNLSFFLGETWHRSFFCADPATDAAIDLTGATAKWRLADDNNSLIELSTASGLTISGSTVFLTCASDRQTAAALIPGTYSHELRVYPVDGAVSTVARGTAVLRQSLFSMPPAAGNPAAPKPLGLLLAFTG